MMFWVCTFWNGEFSPMEFGTVPLYAWLSLIYLILFGSLMAYSAYVWLLKIRPATEVATHAYVNPVVAIVIGSGLGWGPVSDWQKQNPLLSGSFLSRWHSAPYGFPVSVLGLWNGAGEC